MKLLVFAALAVVVAADVSHLSSQYGAPISSYDVAKKSIFGSTTPAPGLHLPVKEQQDFNAQYSNFGVAGASTPSPILDGGFSFTTPAPNVDFSQGFVSSTPAPNVEINPVSFSTTPAPALRFDSGLQGFNSGFGSGFQGFDSGLNQGLVSSTIGPNVEINPVSFSTTPAPFLNYDSGLQGFNLNGLQNAGLLYQNQIAPELRFNSFSTPAPPVVAVQSTTIGGSINDAFGVSGESFEYRPQEQEVHRQLFFYTAPEDPEPVRTRINIAPATPSKKNVKYIFIKAPTAPSVGPVEIAAPPQNEEKTVVYVLVKKPEEEQQIYVKSQDPTEAPKPEVFFIKYKDQKEAEEAISKVQSGQAHAEGHVAATDSGSSNFIETINKETFKSQPIVNYVKSSSGQYSNLNSGLIPSNVGLDSGLSFTTSSPLWNQGFRFTSTPLPSLGLNAGFNQLRYAPVQEFGSGFSYTTPSPSLDLNSGFRFTTPVPTVNIGNSGLGNVIDFKSRADLGQNLISSNFGNTLVSSTEAPSIVSSTIAPELSYSSSQSNFIDTSSPVPFSSYGVPYKK